jgi:HlyD family secretion protein
MTANVTFVYAERKGVLRIPSAALRFRPPDDLVPGAGKSGDGGGGKKNKKQKGEKAASAAATAASATKSVWSLDGDKLKEVAVEIGVSDGNKVEVRGGKLAEGDVLVVDAISKAERGNKNKGLF